jgi:hypothetical protein
MKDDNKETNKELRAGKSNRLKPGAIDEHYIECALEYPFAKNIDNLRMAYELAGVDQLATSQRAYEIHERLRDRIDTELLKKAKDARRMGLTVLMDLAQNADSESVKAQVSTTLTKDLFPNVSIKKTQTIEEIDAEIEQLQRELNEGKELH